MFARLTTITTVASLAILAAAIPGGKPPPTTTKHTTAPPTKTTTVTVTAPPSQPTGGSGASTCSTGPIQCCNSVQSADDPAASLLLGLLGIVVQGVDVLVGLTCSPINVIGVGSGNSCSAQAVCCQNNAAGGLISIGCVPITL